MPFTFLNFFPIISTIRNYNFKQNVTADIFGGITCSIIQIPQGIAYASLACVPPVHGLYVSFFGPLFYMIFGTSQHTSLGSFAVVSLMAGSVVDLYKSDELLPIQICSTLTLAIGIIQLLMAIFRLDFIASYFSDEVVAGFTTAASFYVFISQLKELFGLRNLGKFVGPGNIMFQMYDIGSKIVESNLITVGISVGSIIFLVVGKDYVGPYLKKRFSLKVPIPFELILVIFSTLLSYIFKINEKYNVKVISNIPVGMPNIQIPSTSIMMEIFPVSIGIAVVIVAVHISLAKMFAKKLRYEIKAGQELYALGMTSILCSFFSVYPIACSLGRTIVNVEAGTKTQLSTLASSVVVGAVIMYFGTFLTELPMCVLSSIIIVALKGLLRKFWELKKLYPLSKVDFSIWIVAFFSTLLIDVMPGLTISIVFALMTTIFRTQYPRWHFLANLDESLDYRDVDKYQINHTFNGICIYRFDAPLLFTNIERFRETIQKAVKQWDKSHSAVLSANDLTFSINDEKIKQTISDALEHPPKEVEWEYDQNYLRHFIIDCSGFTFVDYMGVNVLKEVFSELHSKNILVYFASAKAPVRDLFEKSGFYTYVSKDNFYPTIGDAVEIARQRQNNATICILSKLEITHDLLENYLNVTSLY
uniref:STAS domain-containing protein n=1 Tax=Rhabditophanes sp. KR3021 TaxID=114890 RepID=A0AC35TSQ0_9BILA